MNTELFRALDDLEKEEGIPKEYMIERIEQALITAYKRDFDADGDNVEVIADTKSHGFIMYEKKTVVEEIENPSCEITLEQARETEPKAEIGDVLRFEIKTKEFGRIAAQTAKQVIIQGIRESKRGAAYDTFTSKEHEILSAVVTRVDTANGNIMLELSGGGKNTLAGETVMLAAGEQAPGEVFAEGDHIKIYLVEVRKTNKGVHALISRTHPGLVKRLFELEVPEIYDGVVEICSISREAGSRSKIAVKSNLPNVDPIGACVGPRGARVANVVKELLGEKVDIVKYSDDMTEYVAAALAPSEVLRVEIEPGGKTCHVVVPDEQLSLAIGKEGQNARLAAKLTGMKIDIKAQSNA